MTLPTRLPLWIALLSYAPLAVAQDNLGELLDAGAKKLSADEFREELVQRVIVGLTPTGTNLELMYVSNGTIVGNAANPLSPGAPMTPFSGDWKVDDAGKVCMTLRIIITNAPLTAGTAFPYRCQSWFKYKDQYFLADSDTDRQARVLRRTIKQ